jgi:stage II sporulation protein D
VTGTKGTKDISKDAARYYFGLKSNLFTPVLHPAGSLEWVGERDTDRLRDMNVLGAAKIRANYEHTFDSEGRRVGIHAYEWLFQIPARFDFVGKGFGHSVGMSQWGAQAMALKGNGYEAILKHYYQGIALTNVGGP